MGTLYKRNGKGKYYGVYTDANGKRVRLSTGTSVKSDAATILRQWETDANNMRHGIRLGRDVTLTDLLDEYIEYLGNSGDQHQELMKQRIQRVLDANEWTKPTHINQLQLETSVRGFLNLNARKSKRPISIASQGHYIGAMKSFCRWLVRLRQVLNRDPLEAVRKPNASGNRKLVRRYLLHEEWHWLAQTQNALLYETAIQTGLRSNELRHVRPEHLHADHILLPGQFTKNKQQAKQFITADLSRRLAHALPFDMPAKEDVAEQLREDLATARTAWEQAKHKKPVDFLLPKNALGHVLDFHALRHTCGAWLAIAGTNPKIIQSIMRHSTITLTLDTYGHLMPGAESEAALALGALLEKHR